MPDPGVRSFATAEDMFAFMEEQQRLADAAVQEFQRVATFGDRYVTFDDASGLWIYGVVFKSPYAEDAEAEQQLIAHNRRPVRAWSAACPEGELGTIHVSCIMAYVTPRAWVHVETSGWQPPRSFPYFICTRSPLRGVEVPWLDAVPATGAPPQA